MHHTCAIKDSFFLTKELHIDASTFSSSSSKSILLPAANQYYFFKKILKISGSCVRPASGSGMTQVSRFNNHIRLMCFFYIKKYKNSLIIILKIYLFCFFIFVFLTKYIFILKTTFLYFIRLKILFACNWKLKKKLNTLVEKSQRTFIRSQKKRKKI